MQVTQQKKIAILKKVFSEDLESFGLFFFPHHLKLDTPQFHREIYRAYQSDENRIVRGAPRAHAKSTITGIVYLLSEIVHKRRKFILLVSDTYSQATLFLEGVKAEFESNDRLRQFYGDLRTDKWAEGEIIVGDTLIKAIGAGMKVRGLKYKEHRPDLIIVDDLENDELVQSKERREKLERWYNGALIPAGAGSGEDCRVVVIGTILHFDSLLSKMLSDDQYKEYNKKTYAAIMNGKALWPEHLNLTQIEKIKQEYTAKGLGFQFYQEYMNQPVSSENSKFPIEKFKYFTDDQLERKNLITYMAIDRAYSTKKVADFTAILIVSVDLDNNWYVSQAERFKGTELDLINKIFDLQAYWKPARSGMEQKAFEYTIKPTLETEMRKRNQFFSIEELKDGGVNKNMRIEGLIPRFNSGSIFFKKDQCDIIDEMTQFPASTHDDLLDSLAYILTFAEPPMAQQKRQKTYQPLTKYG